MFSPVQLAGFLRFGGFSALIGISLKFLLIGVAPAFAQGISAEEYHLGIPPPPIVQPARLFDDKTLLRWQAPHQFKLRQKPGYDPKVDFYRVYRVGRNFEKTLIGHTQELFFLIATPPGTGAAHYAITAVQKSGQESPLSLEIELPVDRN